MSADDIAFLAEFLTDELDVRKGSFAPCDPSTEEGRYIADAERALQIVQALAEGKIS